ncbi:MAG: ribosome maturation factor RimM [Rhodospirillaceae bacterium]
MSSPARVCLGVVVGVKGLRGEVRIKSFTEVPQAIGAYGPVTTDDGRTFKVTVVGSAQGVVIAKLAGIADRTAAEGLKGAELFVERSALPAPEEGTFYHADLIGADVTLTSGEVIGRVSALHNFGGGDMMEVGEGRDSVLIPLTSEVIAELDVKGGRVMVHRVPGLLGGETDETGKEEDETER